MNHGPTLSSSIYRPLEFETGDPALRISLILSNAEPSIVFPTSLNNLHEDLYRKLIALKRGVYIWDVALQISTG
jgi:hypothetical protein